MPETARSPSVPCRGLRTAVPPVLIGLLAVAAACDNVGRAFDPDISGGGGPTTPTIPAIQVVQEGGDVRDGRPKVKSVFPKGGGWPTTVPIVIEFTESVNEATIRPTTAGGSDGKIILRVRDTTQVLPAQYDFLAGGRILLLRPTPALSNAANSTYQVVLLPEGRDVDGTRFQVPDEEELLAEFTVDEEAEERDGRILTTFPRDNARDATRETFFYVFFTKPAVAESVTDQNLQLRAPGGTPVAADISDPLSNNVIEELRVFRIEPDAPLDGDVQFQFHVASTIQFGQGGVLDFGGRTPFSRFDTIGPQEPGTIAVANPPSPSFPDKISGANLANLQLNVAVPVSASAGDLVVARIYGGDRGTQATNDVAFVERAFQLVGPGAQTVTIDFGNALGTVANPEFDDGPVTFTAQLRRGDEHSGFAHGPSGTSPRFDVTPPALQRVGPPGVETGNVVFTDLESVALFGTANERLGGAELTDGVNPPAAMFASAADGRFVMTPIVLGRLTAPRPFTLTLTDSAGNLGAVPITGSIVQRGLVTGAIAGQLTVEAYDDVTLAPIAGATVLVDPGAPVVPAVGQLTATTDANGRAVFTGLAGTSHTITVVRAGYHLRTLYETGAAFASLPLRPLTDATASLRGSLTFLPAPNVTVLVGSTAFDDPTLLGVQTASSSASTIPPTPIRPNRVQVVTALGGVFEPTAPPTFGLQACQICGNDLQTPTAPPAPAAPGAESPVSLTLLGTTGTIASLAQTPLKDFALASGLDTSNLVGGKPIVRLTASLLGFGGQSLIGVGIATQNTGASFAITGNYAGAIVAGFTPFTPVTFLVAEGRDTGGRISRWRALFTPGPGSVTDVLDPPGIPVVTPPGGPGGPPSVTFDDRLDPTAVPGILGAYDVQAQDGANRQWTILVQDTDVAGGTKSVQFPDLATAGVAGLATGTWIVRAESRLFIALGSGPADFVLSERRRQEATYARSATVNFTVQ